MRTGDRREWGEDRIRLNEVTADEVLRFADPADSPASHRTVLRRRGGSDTRRFAGNRGVTALLRC